MSDSIDITDVVAALEKAFIDFNTALVVKAAQAVPYVGWALALPVVSSLFSTLVSMGVSLIAKSLEMAGFFMNTAIKKAAQAQDLVAAVDYKNNLPPTTSEADYEKAEQAQMAAFSSFVRVTS